MDAFVNLTIVTFNRVECTQRCLESILEMTSYPYVINIIDNGSTDRTREYLESIRHADGYSERINRIVYLDTNMGISPAYNLGWSLSDAPYYVKIDNDVVFLRDDWLDVLVNIAETIDDAAMIGFGENTSGLRHAADDRLYYAGHVGGCTFIKRAVHEKIGFWNEDYGLYGEEDADYGLRARLAGFCNLRYADNKGDFITYSEHIDENISEYTQWKSEERTKNIDINFKLNDVLFKCGFRDLYVGRKFLPYEDNGTIRFRVNKEYVRHFEQLKNRYLPLLPAILQSAEYEAINTEMGFHFYF
ncbi:glycosyltransferase family 2 protein [Desulfovibrio inopinatus]|uniref:glycosyltransferase family 2 protein n=1 Tax=Desulfovibrio inopinatus TaxID=102109 RepID=UPI0004141355|nr:glycosyltransferase [Desulfovibrio inopinatus]